MSERELIEYLAEHLANNRVEGQAADKVCQMRPAVLPVLWADPLLRTTLEVGTSISRC